MLEYIDETKDLEACYTIGGDDELDEIDREGGPNLHILTTSAASTQQDEYSLNLIGSRESHTREHATIDNLPESEFEFGPLSSPSPLPEISRSSHVFASPTKRRKTNDLVSFPLLDRSTSYKEDDIRSLPDQSPAFSFLNLQSPLGPPRRPVRVP